MEIEQPAHRVAEGAVKGQPESRELTVLESGHVEFSTPIDAEFCWRQDEREVATHPRLYPHATVEFPVSFLRFYRALVDGFSLEGPFIVQLLFHNVQGARLPPFRPGVIGYEARVTPLVPLAARRVLVGPNRLEQDFNPELEARSLLREVYGAFGLSLTQIPFFDAGQGGFRFD